MSKKVQINIIAPLYNMIKFFGSVIKTPKRTNGYIKVNTSIIFIDDESNDNTPELMEELSYKDSRFRNFGHKIALFIGFLMIKTN